MSCDLDLGLALCAFACFCAWLGASIGERRALRLAERAAEVGERYRALADEHQTARVAAEAACAFLRRELRRRAEGGDWRRSDSGA